MKRRLASVLVAVSLLLFAAVAAMWVRSYWRVDMLIHAQPGRQTAAWSRQGRVFLDTMGDAHVPLWPGLRGWTRESDPIDTTKNIIFMDHPSARSRRFLGFAYADAGSIGMPTRRITALAIPYWSIVVPLLIPPALALRRARQRRWSERHRHCVRCGYDLRASADRCPECGTPFTPSSRYSGEKVGERG